LTQVHTDLEIIIIAQHLLLQQIMTTDGIIQIMLIYGDKQPTLMKQEDDLVQNDGIYQVKMMHKH
jgi:hypothetical protein